jgi:hypothetical protein
MTGDAKATTFVTAPDGFIGSEPIKVLTSRGFQVLGLSPSVEVARRAHRRPSAVVLFID